MAVTSTDNAWTVLTLSGVGIAPYSARGVSQTLEPIDQARQIVRTVNGESIDISLPQFRKYRSTISCTDQTAPTLSGVWPGLEVEVECAAEMAVGEAGTDRPAVSGSTRTDADGTTFFRPVLQMRVVSFSQTTDEYGAQTSWTLSLEEI